jgi:hypothetical protein
MASSSRITPGEKGEITAKIDIKGRAGFISKNVRVFSNDPKKAQVTLVLRAIIQRQTTSEVK